LTADARSAVWHPSPNFNSRQGHPITMIVLHYTGMPDGAEARARLCDPDAQVSAHYFIEEDGSLYQLVREADRAWHAGVACWQGEPEVNGMSVGIELQNPGHEHGYRPFPAQQIDSLITLIQDIRSRHAVPVRRIVGHADVAPVRKTDPGELFPWTRLARAGCAWMPGPEPGATPIQDLVSTLAQIGYQTGNEKGDPETRAALFAFQRRFLPENLTGEADASTLARLADVVKNLNES